MKHIKLQFAALATGAAASTLCAINAQAQTAEALMEALVRKGILTEQEAEDIKADLAKENKAFVKVRSAGKETVSLDIYGDMRTRYEGFYADDPNFVDRNRFRYRLRIGATATLFDRFEAGFRLTSSEAQGSFGGDPISGNTSFQDNGSKKFVYIDLAYGRWYAFTNQQFMSTLTVGKMENPFVFSDMVFDADYTPEGAALQFNFMPNLDHALKLNLGGFVLDEIGSQSEDPYLLGAQTRWDATWKYNEAHAPQLQSSVGAAWLTLLSEQNLTTNGVPNINRGNTRLPVSGAPLAANFNPLVFDAALTYTFDKVPLYNGAFPVRVAGDYMNNVAINDNNQAYSVGVTFGKAGKRGTWELGYRWKYVESDAWFEEFTDSDFGAFWGGAAGTQTPLNSAFGAGYGAGTNLKGHVVKLSYSPFNSIVLSATWFKTALIDAPTDSDMNRLQVDALWKF